MVLGRIGRYVIREVLLAWLAISAVLILVLLTNRLVRLLGDAAGGDIPAEAVLTLLGLKALAHLGTVLPASLFLGIILAFGRLQRDGETSAMAAAGIGPARHYAALYAIAAPLALAVAAASLVLAPWAQRSADAVVAEAQQDLSLGGLMPGRFTPLGDRGVVYLERFNDDGTGAEVFAWLRGPSSDHVVVANRARWQVDADSGVRHLILENGHRYDLPAGERPWSVIAFGEHGIRVPRASTMATSGGRDARPSTAVWQSAAPEDQAELQWRLALPLTALTLTVVALPLAHIWPRQGRYARVVVAVLVYVAYFNGLRAAQEAVADGRLPAWLGLWTVHAVLLGFGALALAGQLGRLRRRPGGAAS